MRKNSKLSLRERLRWRFKRRHLLAPLDETIARAHEDQRNFRPICDYTGSETVRVRRELNRIRKGLDHDLADGGAFTALSKAIKAVDEQVQRMALLIAQDQQWAETSVRIQAEVEDLRIYSAQFRGRQFAKDVDLKRRDTVAALKGIQYADRPQKVNDKVNLATLRLAHLRELVRQAGEVVKDLPLLSGEIGAIDITVIRQDIACEQAHAQILRMRDQIAVEIEAGRYAVGLHLLRNARIMCNVLRQDITKRSDLARREIDLWIDDKEIAAQFKLESFPVDLSPADVQRWRELRIEIEEIVESRVSRTREAYSRLFPSKRNLGLSIRRIGDWEVLARHARSAQKSSQYP